MKESFPFEENPTNIIEPQDNPPEERLLHAVVERNRSPYESDDDHEPSIDIPEAKVLRKRLAPTPTPTPSPSPRPAPVPAPTPSRPARRTQTTPEAIPPHAVPPPLRKKRTVEVIESTDKPHLEHAFIKYADGKGTKELETIESSANHLVINLSKQEFDSEEKYNFIHTHPSKHGKPTWFTRLSYWITGRDIKKTEEAHPKLLQSGVDMKTFLALDNMKYSTIAVRDPISGLILGYNVLSKTKESPSSVFGEMKNKNMLKTTWRSFTIWKDTRKYNKDIMKSMRNGDGKGIRSTYDDFLAKYKLKSRLVPAAGYKVNDAGISFEKIQ